MTLPRRILSRSLRASHVWMRWAAMSMNHHASPSRSREHRRSRHALSSGYSCLTSVPTAGPYGTQSPAGARREACLRRDLLGAASSTVRLLRRRTRRPCRSPACLDEFPGEPDTRRLGLARHQGRALALVRPMCGPSTAMSPPLIGTTATASLAVIGCAGAPA